MGGFHQTEAYTTEKVTGTGKGDIHAKSGDMNIWVKYIDFSDATDYAFRRDETYKSLSHRKRIVCFDANTSRLSKDIMGMAMQSGAGYQDILSKASMANDMMKLSMGEIQKIAAFLNAVIEGNYPATDEEYYERAITLSESTKSDDLLEAVQIFRKISDYKDSANIADITQQKYEETLQFEKEQKILQKERDAKKFKKILIIATPVIIAIIIGLTIASNKAKKEAAYNTAIQMEKDGEYDEAIKTFEALDGYKDSIDMIKECHYIQALEVIDRLDLDNPNKMAEVVYLWGPYELNKDVQKIADTLDGFIFVAPMVSEAPLQVLDGISVSSLEKELVDKICSGAEQSKLIRTFQSKVEVFSVNYNRLRRYASRRGVQKELEVILAALDTQRIHLISDIQRYLESTRVTRAWLFGSFARGEENETSDIDLLVDYDKSGGLSLLTIVRYKLDMEQLIGREVDLVENGYLKPFAVASAEQDKYLIYER